VRILLIEDDEETSDYIKSGLEECGHAVERAHDGMVCSSRRPRLLTSSSLIGCYPPPTDLPS
jgi:DNA-binding response OmpR family regulator